MMSGAYVQNSDPDGGVWWMRLIGRPYELFWGYQVAVLCRYAIRSAFDVFDVFPTTGWSLDKPQFA